MIGSGLLDVTYWFHQQSLGRSLYLSLFLCKSSYYMVLMENRVNLGNIIWNQWISNGGVGKLKLIGVEDRIRSV